MSCSCEYDIFNYMEIGFISLLLILLVLLIVNEIIYSKKIKNIEKCLKSLKSGEEGQILIKTKNGFKWDYLYINDK